jgi:hypothetical protein
MSSHRRTHSSQIATELSRPATSLATSSPLLPQKEQTKFSAALEFFGDFTIFFHPSSFMV